MFEIIRNNTKALMFVLVLLIIPSFVLVGIEGYTRFRDSNATVAKVAGIPITQAEWDAAHRTQVERIRAQSPDVDPKLLDSPEFRQQTLEALVRERTMLVAADKLRLAVSDARVQRLFVNDPQFAFLRKPDGSVNVDLLKAQGMSTARFTEQLRQDFAMRQVLGGVTDSVLAPASATATALDALLQRREVRIARFEAKKYGPEVKVTDADITAFYDDPANAARFESPEHASVEYLLLDLDAIKSGITVSEEELRKYYDENQSRYATPEERRASHILVKAERNAPAAEREKAKAKATALLAELRKDPGRFAELAKQNSDDPGSAQKGGDLDFFGRGAMTPPFEQAVFAMKTGEISDVVETDFGYHIIQLTAVRGGEKKSFESVKADIENEVKQQLAQRRFAELAETFTNTVYEQSDSLQPAAEKLKLKVQKADVTRTPAQGADDALGSTKFLSALFAEDTIKNKRNTEAVEVGPSKLAAGRVVEYFPARKLPLEAVKDRVREALVARRAAELARKDADAKLAAWKGGAQPQGLEDPITVSRTQAQSLPQPLIDAVMKAPTDPLPSWTRVDFGEEGVALVRIDKLLPRDASTGDIKSLQRQYGQIWAAAEGEAYYEALRERYKVKVTAPAATAAGEAASGAASEAGR